jgi:hypothetical protein
MLFKSKLITKTWDTWMVYHAGTYYLYYSTSETAPGDGFGVATSEDGLHWQDYGRVLGPSDQMVRYLGAGSVWPAVDFAHTGRWLCNYSEWRQEGGASVQSLLFAWSQDLLHWHKLGDQAMFRIDERFYQKVKADAHGPWEWPRWDGMCVIPRPHGGYYGYWTATPRQALGFGFGESADGLHWQALESPRVEWADPPEMYFVEVGGVHEIAGRYYAMTGDYASLHCGMYTLVADSLCGPFRPASQNFGLLCNQSRMHAYFTRFLDTPGGVLVNHHVLARGQFSDPDFETYGAPLKRAVIRAGGLYLAWWEGNDGLKRTPVELPAAAGQPLRFNPQAGILLEGRLELPGSLHLGTQAGPGVCLRVDAAGVTEIGPGNPDGSAFQCEERVDRQVSFGRAPRFRLLLRGTMLEFYLDDLLIQCYMLANAADGRLSGPSGIELKLWQWD